jgi:hypothetical protein
MKPEMLMGLGCDSSPTQIRQYICGALLPPEVEHPRNRSAIEEAAILCERVCALDTDGSLAVSDLKAAFRSVERELNRVGVITTIGFLSILWKLANPILWYLLKQYIWYHLKHLFAVSDQMKKRTVRHNKITLELRNQVDDPRDQTAFADGVYPH